MKYIILIAIGIFLGVWFMKQQNGADGADRIIERLFPPTSAAEQVQSGAHETPARAPQPAQPARLPAPSEMSPEERETVLNWANNKAMYLREYRTLAQNLEQYADGGYTHNAKVLNDATSKLQKLLLTINADNALEAERALRDAKAAETTLAASSKWQAGRRHSRFDKIRSAAERNKWIPDEGYAFARPGTSDLTVKYVGIPTKCATCDGHGQVLTTSKCKECAGRGTVPNEIAKANNLAREVAINMGKTPRTPWMNPERKCNKCKGIGEASSFKPCDKCNGDGKIYR